MGVTCVHPLFTKQLTFFSVSILFHNSLLPCYLMLSSLTLYTTIFRSRDFDLSTKLRNIKWRFLWRFYKRLGRIEVTRFSNSSLLSQSEWLKHVPNLLYNIFFVKKSCKRPSVIECCFPWSPPHNHHPYWSYVSVLRVRGFVPNYWGQWNRLQDDYLVSYGSN